MPSQVPFSLVTYRSCADRKKAHVRISAPMIGETPMNRRFLLFVRWRR